MGPIVGGGAIHAQTNVDPCRTVGLDRCDPGSEAHVRGGTMGHPAVMLCQDLDLVVLDPHRVREPHILPHPLHVLHIPDRTLPEFLETELDFVFGLGEMGMEMHTVMARQLSGLLHDVRRDGKGRTWRQNDLYHRTGARVMISRTWEI